MSFGRTDIRPPTYATSDLALHWTRTLPITPACINLRLFQLTKILETFFYFRQPTIRESSLSGPRTGLLSRSWFRWWNIF